MNQSSKPFRSYLLVGIQFGCLGFIFLTGPVFAEHIGWFVMEMVGGGLVLWAIWAMKPRHLHVFPDIKQGNPLITRGPYQMIRHPMYTVVLLLSLALVGDAFSWGRLGVWMILVVDLVMKLSYEEQLLVQHFPDYHRYQLRTKRILPWIY